MAKRTSATTERSGAESAAGKRRAATQRELPGMVAGEVAPSTTTPATPRRARRATPPAQLRLASTGGSNPPPRPRQQPAAAPAPIPTDTHAAPKRPRPPSNARRFGELREALDDGWEIVQPIFERPLWSAADDSRTAYNFVLRRDQATRLLTVPGTVAVERFIETHKLTVDHRR
jgi:hypothetical protein